MGRKPKKKEAVYIYVYIYIYIADSGFSGSSIGSIPGSGRSLEKG